MAKNRTRTALRPTVISLAVASCFTTSAALANPTGANVVRGTAAIHQAGNLLQITNSPNAIINWQSFSIGANEITRFLQQSPSSAVLNRVTTQNPSEILGSLQSKLLDGVTTGGRVFLINPNGILFGAGAQIDVGGLVASTLRMSDEDFLAGKMRFGDGLGKSVVNDGSIATSAGGSVYLIGSGVTNNGIIRSPQGEVVLAAGNTVELVSPGTPNLRVEIAATDNEARNLGQIISDAGRIGIYAGLINNSGTIRADSAVSEGGRILLKASKSVTLEDSSVLSAQGQGGGRIDVLAEDTVRVAGRLDASAPNGGNGGFIETSAKHVAITDSTRVTTTASNGKSGTWLIDPTDFLIALSGGDITGALLSLNLNAGSVTITSDNGLIGINGGIQVNDPVSWTSNNSLTLIARGNNVVNQPIATTGTGGINLYAGWDGVSTTAPVVQCCGQLAVLAPISTGGDVKLVAGFFLSQNSSGVITADKLMAEAPQVSLSQDFNGARNMVNVLAGRAKDGSFFFSNGKALTIDTVAGVSGVSATSGNGSAGVEIAVVGGNLTVNRNISAAAGASVEGAGSAHIFLATSSSGSIIVQNGANLSATGGNALAGFFGIGGDGSVELNTVGSGGSITVAGGSRIEAFGGNASAGSGSGARGGNATVTLVADQSITVDNATLNATGGAGVGTAARGGGANIDLFASNGPIFVNQSTLTAAAGAGGSFGGGFASVSLSTAGGINISNSSISAMGGAGGSHSGGSANVSFDGGNGAVTIAGSTITASGGSGSPTANGSVAIFSGSSVNVSSSTIRADGAEGNILINASDITVTGSSLSVFGDSTGCCGGTTIELALSAANSINTSSSTLTASQAAGGDFILLDAAGGDVVLGQLVTSALGVVFISANTITDGNASGLNLQTPIANLFGASGIGSIADPLETMVGQISLSSSTGEIGIINTGNLQLNSLSTSGSADVRATGMMTFGLAIFSVGGNLSLKSNGMYVNRPVFAGGDLVMNAQAGNLDIVADGGEGSPISVSATNVSLLGANVNIGGASAPFATQVSASNLLSVTTPGNVMVTGGSGTGADALLVGGVDVLMGIGGTLQLNGNMTSGSAARVEAGSPMTITLDFPLISADGFSVNGVLNAIVDDAANPVSGFFVQGLPAILNTNMFVTYGGPPSFTDVLTATMNQQADVLADQLKAGDTGPSEDKEKKKLPFCSG